ncbi:MAG: FtsX-like permease family protein [Candidatus Bathyarchaeota archaeon]|nr:FtsX-like permease family protein [Candidatus Bathyarchaeota archaeon]
MGTKSSFTIAKRALARRKAKNLSAILAITLGVTLLVGIQITTDTLESSFISSLLQSQGEVDIQVTNSTTGGYLAASEQEAIASLVPDAVGIMPELSSQIPVSVGSQFDPDVTAVGIPADFPKVFGVFYDWQSDGELSLSRLNSNSTVLMSSALAENLGLTKNIAVPFKLNTEFTNVTLSVAVDPTTGAPIIDPTTGAPTVYPVYSVEKAELTVVGIFDSNRPGIGSQYSDIVFALPHLQGWVSLQDPLRQTDQISTYLISLKTNHFTYEISEDYLKEQVEALKNQVPQQTNPLTGESYDIYAVTAPRLNFFNVAAFFMTLLSSVLTALGLLIMITGVLLITNVQLMNVEDREFQTGVLRAVGENRTGIFRSMLIENLLQGVIGGVLGLFGGIAFGQGVAYYLVSIFRTGEFSVQPVISQEIVIISVIVGVLLSIVTGLLPAMRASRVNIVEALRGIKTRFEEKTSQNLVALGALAIVGGCVVLLFNGVFESSTNVIWTVEGWDTLGEWRNILIGSGLLFTGIGLVLSRFISATKAFNITALALWLMPTLLFVVAMGTWITDIIDISIEILMIGVMEIIVGSVLFVALNLPVVMKGLRRVLIKVRGLKGVGQISPALISSHKSRSTLTFAIFAVILTLNVLVATLIPTNLGTVTQSEEDSRGVDFFVSLNKPEALISGTSYASELYKLDSSLTDVIGLRTYYSATDYTKFTVLVDPASPQYNPTSDMLPLKAVELRPEQILGNATSPDDENWRYDFYLSGFPDGVREQTGSDMTNDELLDLSKQSWELFFDPNYKMPAYNVTLDILSFYSGESDMGNVDVTSALGGFAGDDLEDVAVLRAENGTVIENPIVFTDSYLLPLGMQIWLPTGVSSTGVPMYQAFTIAGKLDYQRAGGFPLSGGQIDWSKVDITAALGAIYLPEYWANQTAFFPTSGVSARTDEQFDHFLIKTSYAMDDPQIESIAQAVEEYTNTNDQGYRELAEDNFVVASATVLYSKIQTSMEMVTRLISFLQIYVTFGLIIGAVGMSIISVRNVSERKREIGMMRAIGFPKAQVMTSVLLELVVLGIIGLVIGIVNGLIISLGFANMQNVTLVIPWQDIGIYLSIIILIALGAGAVPGWLASRIPPAESLRYVG